MSEPFKQKHMALGAFTPVYYRWEVMEVLPVSYPDFADEWAMEPNVGQREDDLLPDDAAPTEPIWSLYGRRIDNGLADHIADQVELPHMLQLVRNLGASHTHVLPGPTITVHGRKVVFENDVPGEWTGGWGKRGDRIADIMHTHVAEVINTWGPAWKKCFTNDATDMPYAAQYILEETIKKLERIV